MEIPRRLAFLLLLATSLLSIFVSGIYSSYAPNSDHHLQLIVTTAILLVLIGISGKLLYYQHALKAAKLNLDEAQQLAGLGSLEWDIATGKTYWSDNCFRLFNLAIHVPAPDMEAYFNLVHPGDRPMLRTATQDALRYGSCYEVRCRLANDPENRTYLSRGKVITNESGKAITLIGSVQDITHKVHREQIREELVKQKDLFISRLGHDLKTPLTPLITLLPLLQSRSTDHRQKELLGLCINSATHINELVIKTLRLARLASDADTPLHHSSIIISAAAEAAAVALRRNGQHPFSNLIPHYLTVVGNQQELEELFEQIFSNAQKFSPHGAPITVTASHDERANIVTIQVQDNGIGLLPEEQEHIFEDFYKADTSRHSLESSGLGLTICRRIVEHHGGRIVASSPGKNGGTVISFTLKAGGQV